MAIKRYTPREVNRMSEDQLRKAYSHQRSIARKRSQRLIARGYGEYDVAQEFPKLKDVKDIKEELLDVSLDLADPRTTLTGMKAYVAATLENLHESGYTFINASNLKSFGDFMESKRALFASKILDSDRVARLFEQSERLKVSPNVLENKFGEYLADVDKLDKLISTMENMEINKGAARVSSSRILAKLK